MSNEKVTQLPAVSAATLSDIIYAVQAGISSQETLQQVFNLFVNGNVLINAGNPNGTLAGTANQFCWDTTHLILWLCTTTGSSSTAVWQLVSGQGLTNGQLLIGSSGTIPSKTTLTAGTNISITNGAGSITIASSGAGGFSWTDVSGTSQAMSPFNGYVADNSGLVTLTLPVTAAFGSTLVIVGKGSGGWLIAQNSGQNIVLGSSTTTTGATGSLASTNAHDSISLVCTVANTTWTQVGAPQGNLTVA